MPVGQRMPLLQSPVQQVGGEQGRANPRDLNSPGNCTNSRLHHEKDFVFAVVFFIQTRLAPREETIGSECP